MGVVGGLITSSSNLKLVDHIGSASQADFQQAGREQDERFWPVRANDQAETQDVFDGKDARKR